MRIDNGWMRAPTIVIVLALVACRSDRRARAGDTSGARDMTASGGTVAMREFHGDRQAAIAGRELFLKYNCYGCHGGLGGGAMGPSLRDDEWKYGGTDSAIVSSIANGRPAGMPAWKGTIPPQDISGKLLTYIRSMRTSAEPTFFFSPTDTTTHAGVYPSTTSR